jgi:hypothetical protein
MLLDIGAETLSFRNVLTVFPAGNFAFSQGFLAITPCFFAFIKGFFPFSKGYLAFSHRCFAFRKGYSHLAKGFWRFPDGILGLAKGFWRPAKGISRLSNGVLGLSKGKTGFQVKKTRFFEVFACEGGPTQAQVQAIQDKLNELINAITRPAA